MKQFFRRGNHSRHMAFLLALIMSVAMLSACTQTPQFSMGDEPGQEQGAAQVRPTKSTRRTRKTTTKKTSRKTTKKTTRKTTKKTTRKTTINDRPVNGTTMSTTQTLGSTTEKPTTLTQAPSTTTTQKPTTTTTTKKPTTTTTKPWVEGWNVRNGKTYYMKNGVIQKGWVFINGLRFHFNESTGVKDSEAGIDVSSHNGTINWQKVKDAGVFFVFIRVGYRGYGSSGSLNYDTNFEANYNGARAVGLKIGVYFYSVPINQTEAIEEANFVLAKVKNLHLDLPIVTDVEHEGNRVAGLTPKQRTDNTLAFLQTIKNAGKQGMLYTGYYYRRDLLQPSRLTEYPLWLAYYTSDPSKPGQAPYACWQYSESGVISGASSSGVFDFNVMYDNS